MIPIQIVFVVTVLLTVLSGIGAAAIVVFGDTQRNAGQRAVAEKFAHVAAIGATAIAAMLASPFNS